MAGQAIGRVTKRYKKSIYMMHYCSRCGYPLVSKVDLCGTTIHDVYQDENETLLSEQNAAFAAETEMHEKVSRIENCWKTKEPVFNVEPGHAESKYGCFCDVLYSGHDTPCPICLNLEPWQGFTANPELIYELKKENFPTVFNSQFDAESVPLQFVNSTKTEIATVAKTIDDKVKAALELKEKQAEYDELMKQQKFNPEKQRFDACRMELEALDQQWLEAGTTEFLKKNDLVKRIDEKYHELELIEEAALMAEDDFFEDSMQAALEISFHQAVAFGVKGKAKRIESKNVGAYTFDPKDIPDQIKADFSEENLRRYFEAEDKKVRGGWAQPVVSEDRNKGAWARPDFGVQKRYEDSTVYKQEPMNRVPNREIDPQPQSAAKTETPTIQNYEGITIIPPKGGNVDIEQILRQQLQPQPTEPRQVQPQPTEPRQIQPQPVQPQPVPVTPQPVQPQGDTPEFIFCHMCGKKLSGKARFCSKCGTKLF